MAKGDFLGTGWKYPVSVSEGKIEVSSGDECIAESIKVILNTAKGERVMRPDFGCDINKLVFEVNSASTTTLVSFYVKQALQKWEPRIDVLDVSAYPDEEERSKLIINIEYKVKSTNTRQNLVYPFYIRE